MKKTIISGALAFSLLFPVLSSAQTTNAEVINSIRQQIISLIYQEIAILQTQLVQVLAQQQAPIAAAPMIPANISTGTLQGQATAIPFCPSGATPCVATADKYTQFGIYVYQGNTRIEHVSFNSGGSYSTILAPGTYTIYRDNQPPGIAAGDSWTANLPQDVTIVSGSATTLNITINYPQY